MGLNKWLKKQAAAVAISLASVEKEALGQKGGGHSNEEGMHQSINQGRLSDDLLRGEVTQQVKELRWRTYKVIQASENWSTKVTYEYENGIKQVPIYNDDNEIVDYELGVVTGKTVENIEVGEDKYKNSLSSLNLDSYDDYKPELCVINDEITKSVQDTMGNSGLEVYDEPIIYSGDSEEGASLGEIKSDLHSASDYTKPILVEREFRPRIELERFTTKLVVRRINDTDKLLEFYISKYADEYDKRTSLVISECKKIMDNGRRSDMTDIQNVGFITMKDIGVPDYLQYEYEVTSFDKIIEYKGSYVLKFKSTVKVDGENILAEFLEDGLEDKYKNKERRST